MRRVRKSHAVFEALQGRRSLLAASTLILCFRDAAFPKTQWRRAHSTGRTGELTLRTPPGESTEYRRFPGFAGNTARRPAAAPRFSLSQEGSGRLQLGLQSASNRNRAVPPSVTTSEWFRYKHLYRIFLSRARVSCRSPDRTGGAPGDGFLSQGCKQAGPPATDFCRWGANAGSWQAFSSPGYWFGKVIALLLSPLQGRIQRLCRPL